MPQVVGERKAVSTYCLQAVANVGGMYLTHAELTCMRNEATLVDSGTAHCLMKGEATNVGCLQTARTQRYNES